MNMAYLLIKNAHLLLTVLHVLMGDVLTKIADLLVTT